MCLGRKARRCQEIVGRRVWNVKCATLHGFHAAPPSPDLARAQTFAPTRRATSTTIRHAAVAILTLRSHQASGYPWDDVTHAQTLARRRATMACRGIPLYPPALAADPASHDSYHQQSTHRLRATWTGFHATPNLMAPPSPVSRSARPDESLEGRSSPIAVWQMCSCPHQPFQKRQHDGQCRVLNRTRSRQQLLLVYHSEPTSWQHKDRVSIKFWVFLDNSAYRWHIG